MTELQEQALRDAQAYCDEHDKSTEFMLQYMADCAECEVDDVVDWLMERKDKLEAEMKLCRESPYYFAMNYLVYPDGTRFQTHLTEKEFNLQFKYLQEKSE